MICALLFMAMIGWGCWLMFRDTPARPVTTPADARAPKATGTTSALGLEDDPDQWRAARGAWTALDECQLIRLLTDSAPINRARFDSFGGAPPPTEHEDTP